jgi:uncharacterized glyoxalase superfamily protein PhnB
MQTILSPITVTTQVNVSPKKAWDIWTTPAHITQWNQAPDDWHTPHAEIDLVAGGKLLWCMEVKDGSMGFTVNKGNNVYINLDTDSREQTDQLFNALSKGGQVSMPLRNMFWGAYFGSCTDKFGVQWMFGFATRNPYAR